MSILFTPFRTCFEGRIFLIISINEQEIEIKKYINLLFSAEAMEIKNRG